MADRSYRNKTAYSSGYPILNADAHSATFVLVQHPQKQTLVYTATTLNKHKSQFVGECAFPGMIINLKKAIKLKPFGGSS